MRETRVFELLNNNGEKKLTWGLLMATSTLLLALLGAFGSGLIGDIEKLDAQVNNLTNRLTLLENNYVHIKDTLQRVESKVDQLIRKTED